LKMNTPYFFKAFAKCSLQKLVIRLYILYIARLAVELTAQFGR
jgi:hypothetical protein